MVKEYLENRYRYSKRDLPSLIEPSRDRSRETSPSEPEKQQKKMRLNLPQSSKYNIFDDKPRIETVDIDQEECKQAENQSDDNVMKGNNEHYKNNSKEKMKSTQQQSRK